MSSTITISVEELNRMIDERVQTALANTKPVRDGRMKELEAHLKDEYQKKHLDKKVHWYTLWTTIRTSVAMRMGYASVSKVPPSRYDELLKDIKREIDTVIEVLTKEETR